jgi:calcium-translocating P-type ATPase
VNENISWHALSVEESLGRLDVSREGLSEQEAALRLDRFGPNRLTPPKRHGLFMRFLLQFHNILIYVLLASGVGTAALGEWVDTSVILGVVIINAIIGVVQEGKAEKALDAIRNMLSPQAVVLRDGKRTAIDAGLLVPGDIVLLQSGDKVPADLRLIEARGLLISEAALTGESLPVEKSSASVNIEAALGDRSNMAFAGTIVASGQGRGMVAATGDNSEVGRIGVMLAGVEKTTTPLLKKMDDFGQKLTIAILALSAMTFLVGVYWRGYAIKDMFMAVVGLAVAAIPEGLPAILTITMALGVERMAKRSAIIRRLPAVETLGSVTVICSDKTGTLTRNEMNVRSLAIGADFCEVTGEGYSPTGEIRGLSGEGVEELARAAALCCDSTLRRVGDEWLVDGDPTEGALLSLAMKAGLDAASEVARFPRTDSIPFESEHRFMATLHHDHDGHGFILLKGAPETVFAKCAGLDLAYWQGRVEEMAARGERVLALAKGSASANRRSLSFVDVETGFTLLGLCGLADPPRSEAINSIEQCLAAGIRVKMITGDHVGTALAIGRQLGLVNAGRALSGPEIEAMDDQALQREVGEIDIFARAAPEHKLRLVKALQANGEILAMTGDGVNDSPALKRADVGVAMGKGGTDAAKEVSSMVLADDNFASLAHAVEEGRTIFDNIRKAIVFTLPTNGGEGFVIVIAIMLGMALPITPLQILWVNMITAVTLALALAFEPPEPDVMRRPPRPPGEALLSGFLVWRICLVTVLLVIGVFSLFAFEMNMHGDVDLARTVAVNVLVAGQGFYLLNSRSLTGSVLNRQGMLGSRAALIAIGLVMAAQLLYTYAPPLQALFSTQALGLTEWLRIIAMSGAVFLLLEIEKIFWRRRG